MERAGNIFTPWGEKQERVIFSEKPIILFACGIQSGKTTAGAIRTRLFMSLFKDLSDAFLIIAPTYKIMQQSTLPAFLQLMEGLGTYSRSDAIFKMYKGGTCYLRTATDPDSIVGITNIRHVWGDEAGLYSLYLWENMLARAAFKNAPILLTTSPYSLNWVYKDLIRPKQKNPNARPDVDLIQARSDENPYFPKNVYEERKKTMEPRRFNMMFGGEWHKMEGLVFDCFSDEENVCEPFALPLGTIYLSCVDWGFTNPTAMLVVAITPDGDYYVISETYQTGLTIKQILALGRSKKMIFNVQKFFCDPARPEYIQEFNEAKLTALAYDNEVRTGIDLLYELIKTRKLKIFKNAAPFLVDELETYHWPSPKDLRLDQDDKDQNPVKQGDHAIDCLRGLVLSTYRTMGRKVRAKYAESKSPYQEESLADTLKRLKHDSREDKAEKWS